MGVTFDETEKRFVFDFEHDGAEDIGLSIQRPVDSVHKKIDLYHYDIVVMPQNRTKVNLQTPRVYTCRLPGIARAASGGCKTYPA